VTYLIVRNWDKFQHYKDRNPPWIKNNTELPDEDEYRDLSFAARGVLRSAAKAPGPALKPREMSRCRCVTPPFHRHYGMLGGEHVG
jgi:hypothetical protein